VDKAKSVFTFKSGIIVYSLRYKILFIMCGLITSAQTLLGDINASKYYTDHTREFLGYLGHANPSEVPVRKMDQNETTSKSGLCIAGYTDGRAIYLNEDFFARNHSEGINLFTCAHEAAHYVLRHSSQKGRINLEIEKEADVHAARMLCKHGYKWVVNQKVRHLKRLIDAGKGDLTDGKHPTLQQEYVYLSKVLETNSKNNNSYKEAVEDIKDFFTSAY